MHKYRKLNSSSCINQYILGQPDHRCTSPLTGESCGCEVVSVGVKDLAVEKEIRPLEVCLSCIWGTYPTVAQLPESKAQA